MIYFSRNYSMDPTGLSDKILQHLGGSVWLSSGGNCITVQTYSLPSDNSTQSAAVWRRLERNFEILSQLSNYWPTLVICFTRLQASTRPVGCKDSVDESLRLDRWMLKVLVQIRSTWGWQDYGPLSSHGSLALEKYWMQPRDVVTYVCSLSHQFLCAEIVTHDSESQDLLHCLLTAHHQTGGLYPNAAYYNHLPIKSKLGLSIS
jgi:hypothetical protein